MTTDLVTWLRQQLDELEESASGADGAYIYFDAIDDEARDFYLERDLPKLVLAEVDAKRRILDLHQCAGRLTGAGYGDGGFAWCETCGSGEADEYPTEWPCDTLKLLALPYADREGYDESWRP